MAANIYNLNEKTVLKQWNVLFISMIPLTSYCNPEGTTLTIQILTWLKRHFIVITFMLTTFEYFINANDNSFSL